jgi:beta-lactamase class A
VKRGGPNILRWVSIGLLLGALSLFFYELVAFSRKRARMPEGLSIAGVPVGGLDISETHEHLLQIYSTPVEVLYDDQIILMTPASVGFRLDTEVMIAAAELERTGTDFWSGFWGFLWNRPGESVAIPLRAEYSTTQLEAVLRDIAARYDEPPIAPDPIPGSPNFSAGKPGRVLDISRAKELIGVILQAPTNRRVVLPVVSDAPPKPTLQTLEVLIKQNVDVAGFDGLVVLYLVNLRTGDEIHFVYFHNQDIAKDPDIAFTAASTIKIGIMVAFHRFFDEPFDPEVERWLNEMITLSGNDPADWLMERIDKNIGPLTVTETLQEIGLENTFTAGYFRIGAELLRPYQTPANLRGDINTRPDPYTQTTATEIGMLLTDLYTCVEGGGTLLAVFSDEIKPDECRQMIDMLSRNKIGWLIEAGVPEGTRVAHKHGWPLSPIDMISDVGIVYTPGGDYVLSLFLWSEREMIWDPSASLFAGLSRTVYNYFNPPLE